MTTDIIGDVHGHADELEFLLHDLGYRERSGAYRHSEPGRKALFLGDLIDRGPKQLRAVDIARRMRDAGSADILMGNHEHNAIGYATPDPDRPKYFLRIRGTKNRAQHAAFLEAVGEDSALHRELVDWMKTLPLFMESDGFLAVHACWHAGCIAHLKGMVADSGGVLPEDLLLQTFRRGSRLNEAAEIILKGVEIALPDGVFFHDKDGHKRTKSRLRWWDDGARTFASAAIAEEGVSGLPEDELPPEATVPHLGNKLVFFGHYWMPGDPHLLTERKTCLDFSIAKGGSLCAYTWRGEDILLQEHLTWVGNREFLPMP